MLIKFCIRYYSHNLKCLNCLTRYIKCHFIDIFRILRVLGGQLHVCSKFSTACDAHSVECYSAGPLRNLSLRWQHPHLLCVCAYVHVCGRVYVCSMETRVLFRYVLAPV